MSREIAQAFERGAKRVGTEVGQGVGKAVHRLFDDTRTNLVKNVEAHEKHDLESASALTKAARHTDESPHAHAGGSVTPQQINAGASPHVPAGPTTKSGGGAPSVSDINSGPSPHVHQAPTTHEASTSPASAPGSPPSTAHRKMHDAQAKVDDGARTFADDAAATAYGRREWNDHVAGLSPEQRADVRDYTREDPKDGRPTYHEINGELRSGRAPSPAVQHHIDNIDRALAGHPTSENVVVTRGTGVSHFEHPVHVDRMRGKDVDDAGYTSASLGGPAPAFADKDAVLHLHVPQGTPAMWVENVSKFGGGEREILLGRGMSYHIDDVVRADNQWHIYGRVNPPGGS